MTETDSPPPLTPASSSARLRHGTRQREHPVIRGVATVLAAVLGFGMVYYYTFTNQIEGAINARSIDDLVDKIEGQEDPPTDGSQGRALNILLMGSDARSSGSSTTDMRNDTTMIMHISADRTRVDVVSIPRDAQVTVPNCRLRDGTEVRGWTGNFNIAFSNGGRQGNVDEAAACVVNTVQQVFGVPIDHYVAVDFNGFSNMIDSLGGVPMCIPERIVSSKANLDLEPGAQVLDGDTALAFARLRTAEVGSVSGSDLQRISRQQELMQQTARTALSKNMLTDISQLTQFIRAGAESLTMDETMAETDYLLGLAYSLRNIDDDNINFATVPWQYTPDFLRVEILPEAEQMWDDLINDRPLSVTAEGDRSSEWDTGRVDASAEATTVMNVVNVSNVTPVANDAGAANEVNELLSECRGQ